MGIFSDRLENAIKNNYIKIYYQPVVRTLSGKLCGFVALARWDDPEFGIIGPDLFIPELEQNKIIHKLDCYVIDEICRNYKVQSENGFSMVPVSFNLSRLDFTLCDIFFFYWRHYQKIQCSKRLVYNRNHWNHTSKRWLSHQSLIWQKKLE